MRLSSPEPRSIDRGPARVVEALESTRREMRRCRLSTAIVGIAMAEIAAASVIAVADLSWVLPNWARGLGLVAMALLAVAALFRTVMAPALRYGKGDAAAEVEASFPELGQRVRTTLEYAEPTPSTAPASPSMVRALAEDTDRQSRGLEFPAIVPWAAFGRRALGLGAAIVGILLAMAYEPTLRIAAARLMLRPAHYTGLAVHPGDRTIKAGTDFALRATITGRPVASARWLRRPVGARKDWAETSMATPPGPGERPRPLLGTLESVRKDCREDFEYKVVAGEVESDVYRVTVIHPLALKSLEAAIEPPAYTRRAPSVAKEGNFQAPEGSRVRLKIELDRAPRSARLTWNSAGNDATKSSRSIPLKIEGTRLSGELPTLTGDIHYEVLADASDGMKLEPARYLIRVLPDEKPTVKFVRPAESYAALPTTEVPFRVEAGDDYGLSRVGIVFRVNDGPEQSLYLDQPADRPTRVEASATLFLENFKLSYTDSLTYHAFVEDNRAPDPWRVTTELRYVDILPYKQSYQMVDGGQCDGSSVTLEELIARQRQAMNRAFAHVDDRPVEPGVADRLSKEEAELALVTGEFAQKLASEFGPISPLDDAARLMESATVALDSKDLVKAVPVEQSALASLIQARRNLRKLMSNSKSSSQCRKLDRQQQKLRKPPPKDNPKEAELARLEQDLRKLAENQKKFAEEIDPKGGGGAQFDQPDESKAKPGSKPSPGDRQRASAKESNRLKGLMGEDRALTDLARSRMAEAERKVNAASEAIDADRPAEAGESARLAGEELARLAEQVAGLKAKELAAKLARARDLAQATAKAERALANGEQARPAEAVAAQVGLAEEARTLDDLLRRAGLEAKEEDRSLAQAVGKASEANPPLEIEQAMRRAAAGLASGEPRSPARAMEAAAGRLEALARDLEAARREFVQPRLEQLMALEKKAAEVQKALESAPDAAKKAEAEKALGDLARAMTSLRLGDGPIRDAADALDEATQSGSGVDGWAPPKKLGTRPGFFTPPIATTNAVRGALRVLQAKIQELILNDALVDRDGAVPPGYKEMVEDYFRLLSEDLR